jgi:hypothetical protein
MMSVCMCGYEYTVVESLGRSSPMLGTRKRHHLLPSIVAIIGIIVFVGLAIVGFARVPSRMEGRYRRHSSGSITVMVVKHPSIACGAFLPCVPRMASRCRVRPRIPGIRTIS